MANRNGHPGPGKAWTVAQVARGRELARSLQGAYWELGDLILEIAPVGEHSQQNGAKAVMRAFAAEIGVDSWRTLQRCRTVAHAYPPDKRQAGVSFGFHREVMKLPPARRPAALKRIAAKKPPGGDKWTTDEVRLMIGAKPVKHNVKPARTGREAVAKELRFALGRVQRAIDAADDEDIATRLRELEAHAMRVLREASRRGVPA